MTDDADNGGALANLSIIDLTRGDAGRYCARLFAEQGAQVIRVESPKTKNAAHDLDRGKLSVSLDYATQAGANVLRRLAEDADAIIEDLPPSRNEALGIGSDALIARIPRLVFCQVAPDGGAELGLHGFIAALAAMWRAAQTEHGQVVEVDIDALANLPDSVRPEPVEGRDSSRSLFTLHGTPAPALHEGSAPGADTTFVLEELAALDSTAVEALRAQGVV